MQPERWRKIEEIYHAALQREESRRPAFLAEACAGDGALREEVESLLAQKDGSIFIERPALEFLARDMAQDDSQWRQAEEKEQQRIGSTVSRYRILQRVGRGGMGVVYKATDTRLKRTVALKFLPQELAQDAQALERFYREAQAASALDHPNICTIYDFGEDAGQPFIVMQYLEGETVRQRIGPGTSGKPPLQLDTLLDLAIQTAEGLGAAHKKGIIHRDIKPANIFVTTAGQAKILDFGLAKLEHQAWMAAQVAGASSDSTAPLTAEHPTSEGKAIGTVPYMSPEQARGEQVDSRTDLFSFAVALYEMATGRRAFPGESPATVFDAILNRAPIPALRLNPELPPELERIVNKGLEKDRALRYQSADEIGADLKRLRRDTGSPQTASSGENKTHRVFFPDRRFWRVLVPAALLVVVTAIGLTLYLRWRQKMPRLTDKDTIVLADFTNKTGDPVFDDTLKQALAVALRQSPFLNILSDDQVAATLRMMERPAGAAMTEAVAREVCQRAGSRAYLAGSIAALGGQYVLGLKAVGCVGGETLAEEQVTAAGKEKVLRALGQETAKLRAELGESLASIRKFGTPLEKATTSSLEALNAYSLARKVQRQEGFTAALPSLQLAVRLDPNFAIANANLGMVYGGLRESASAREYLTRAFDLREHASESERLQIEALFYDAVTGELEKAAQIYQEWIANYPSMSSPYVDLAEVRTEEGDYAAALKLFQQAVRLEPNAGVTHGGLGLSLMELGRRQEAREAFEQALSRQLDDDTLHAGLYALAFLDGDLRHMAAQAKWYDRRPELQHEILSLEADTQAYGGHLASARQLTRQAVDAAVRAGNPEAAALWRVDAALREAAFGNALEARRETAVALKLAPDSRNVEAQAALAKALAGDAAGALDLESDLKRRFPLDTLVNFYWLPTVDATMKLSANDPKTALESLGIISSRLEQALPVITGISACLYPVYVGGEAYLAAGEGGKAAEEFQKILNHRGVVINCPTGALAQLNLGRAFAVEAGLTIGALPSLAQQAGSRLPRSDFKGNTHAAEDSRTKARAAYESFFTLWKDADPVVPVLKQAKAEYAALQRQEP